MPKEMAGTAPAAVLPPRVPAAAGPVPGSVAEAHALSLPATPDRVRQAEAYLAAHPVGGRVIPIPRPVATGPVPAASAWTNWWGVLV